MGRAATLARITGEVTATAAPVEAQRLKYLNYRDQILPQALEVERMAEDSYRLGQTGIAALLQTLPEADSSRRHGKDSPRPHLSPPPFVDRRRATIAPSQ